MDENSKTIASDEALESASGGLGAAFALAGLAATYVTEKFKGRAEDKTAQQKNESATQIRADTQSLKDERQKNYETIQSLRELPKEQQDNVMSNLEIQ